jgi:hypothetical protein
VWELKKLQYRKFEYVLYRDGNFVDGHRSTVSGSGPGLHNSGI